MESGCTHLSIVTSILSEDEEGALCFFAVGGSSAGGGRASSGSAAADAVTCNPLELSPCIGAITSSQPPSRTCCDKVREQRPCLCGYLKDPNLRQYVNSPNARRVATTCGVPIPTC
ncbi:unnamed protein product [Thlaspi arvense]|uniref:Bifunctional inhibitor/plant lipid transfer protein/seed storage helical domain-containing protein n=1 Tax=Thlaspi arvense TaxID=13288 RepID=A0AAU9RT88_THLAR|nr:unnamed protein product [Thlaspi arvense]